MSNFLQTAASIGLAAKGAKPGDKPKIHPIPAVIDSSPSPSLAGNSGLAGEFMMPPLFAVSIL